MVPDSTVLYTALVGFVVVAIIFTLELRRWRILGEIIGRRQRILRTVLIVLIELLFVMILAGPWLIARHKPVVQLFYWSVCMIIGLAVVVLAFVDLRAVTKGYAALTRGLLSELKEDDEQSSE